MVLIDRTGAKHKVNSCLIKDTTKLRGYISKACDALMLNNLKSYLPGENSNTTVKENKEAIDGLLPYITDDVNNFDMVMLKQSLVWFIGKNRLYNELPYFRKNQQTIPFHDRIVMQFRFLESIQQRMKKLSEDKGLTPEEYQKKKLELQNTIKIAQEMGIIEEEYKMVNELTVGTTIVDRNGKEFKAYSYLVNEYYEAMELITKIDTVNMSHNITTEDDSFIALMEIMYRALDRKVDKEEILSSLDAEFARKLIRVYYDLI